MPEASHAAPDLDARLTEIDDCLRLIQSELVPERRPAPSRLRPPDPGRPAPPDAAPEEVERPPPPAAPPPLAAVADPHAKLLAAMRELLDAYGMVLAQLRHAPAATGDSQTA